MREDESLNTVRDIVKGGRMVSYADIIKRLLPGDYSTSSGNPLSPEHFEDFVRRVKEKVPELRGKEDWEVESITLEAIEWARDNICKELNFTDFSRPPDFSESVGLYVCYHPEIGNFYMVVHEEMDAASASGYFGFLLTKDKERAKEDYRYIVKEESERLEE